MGRMGSSSTESTMKALVILVAATVVSGKVLVSRIQDDSHTETELDRLERVLTKKIEDASVLTKKIEDASAALMSRILRGERTLKSEEFRGTAICGYQERVLWPHGSEGLMDYDRIYEEVNDGGSEFDKKTGRFTAGQSGVYLVSVSANSGFTNNDAYLTMFLRTSSGKYQDGFEPEMVFESTVGTTNTFAPMSSSRYISMEKGESIYLEYACGGVCTKEPRELCVSLYM